MPHLKLSHSICLLGLCGLWSCGQQETQVADEKPVFQQQPAVAAAPAPAKAESGIRVETDAQGRKTATLNPKQAEQLADGLMAKGQLRQAQQILSRVIQLNPKATEAYVKRAAIMAESKLTTQAISDMTKAVLLAPDNARFRNTRGYFYLTQQAYQQAMQDFSDAIGLDGNFSQAHNNRGLARVALKEFEAGIKDFDEALKIDAKYVDAYNNKGYALLQMDKFEEAIADFSKAIEINPKYVNAWNNRGQARLKAKQGDKAIADFSEAIKLVPGNVTYLSSRAEAYELTGKTAEALADRDRAKWVTQLVKLTQQVQQNPRHPAVWIDRGRHLLSSSELKPALADFQTALKVSPGNVEAHCGCAATLLQMGNADEAIVQCNAALAKGVSALAISIRGDANFKKGNLDFAIEDYTTAKRRDSQVAQAYKLRAEKARAEGNASQADADMAIAAELDPAAGAVRQVSNEVPAKN